MLEPIKMLECRFNLFPAKFYWQGQVYQIDAVNECKTIAQSQNIIYHFWVRCEGRLLHLIHSLNADHWALQRD